MTISKKETNMSKAEILEIYEKIIDKKNFTDLVLKYINFLPDEDIDIEANEFHENEKNNEIKKLKDKIKSLEIDLCNAKQKCKELDEILKMIIPLEGRTKIETIKSIIENMQIDL